VSAVSDRLVTIFNIRIVRNAFAERERNLRKAIVRVSNANTIDLRKILRSNVFGCIFESSSKLSRIRVSDFFLNRCIGRSDKLLEFARNENVLIVEHPENIWMGNEKAAIIVYASDSVEGNMKQLGSTLMKDLNKFVEIIRAVLKVFVRELIVLPQSVAVSGRTTKHPR
jgi:hypothetical protein